MDLGEMYDYIALLLADAALLPDDSDSEEEFELAKIRLISQARLVLDIIEGQAVHELRSSLPQTSYSDIGDAQGISKQASRIRHTKLEQVLRVHQLDGRRHSLSKAVVSTKHRRAAAPVRQARRRTPREP
ncbi:hypothetical protein [Nakamurella sp.]|uniref:hypothetical protein n=1 Tax=Nakamurella sp. TaxID=1869182 RepID=UPI003783E03C